MDFDEFVQNELDSEVGNAQKVRKRKNDEEVSGKKEKNKKQVSKVHEEEKHHQQLSRLATTDPEFYEFLKNTDQDLLNFGGKTKADKESKAKQVEKAKPKVLKKEKAQHQKKKPKVDEEEEDSAMDDDEEEEESMANGSGMSIDVEGDDDVDESDAESENDFELQSSEEEYGSEGDMEMDEEDAPDSSRRRNENVVIVTDVLIDSWCATLRGSEEAQSARMLALRALLNTFIAAVSNATQSDEAGVRKNDDDDDGTKKNKKRGKKRDADEQTGRKSVRELDSLRKREAVAKQYRVHGNQMFNKTVSACLSELPTAFDSLFDMQVLMNNKADSSKKKAGLNASNSEKQSRTAALRGTGALVELYCAAVTDLLAYLGDTQTQCAVLRHALRITPLFAAFPRRLRVLARCAARIWSSDEEPCRVLAFLIVHRAVKLSAADFAEFCFKRMYLAFVRNSKFTSVASLGCIRFMQRCVVELFSCNWTLAFRYAFIYTRQLAVFLRNALCQNEQRSATGQKAASAGVHNQGNKNKKRKRGGDKGTEHDKGSSGNAMRKCVSWQFVHSLTLWARLVVAANQRGEKGQFELLVYPLVELANGLIRLCDAPAYYPLRIHLVRVLTMLSSGTGRFVPALAPLLAVLSAMDLNRRCVASNSSKKPLNFACTLRLSTAALRDRRAFLDGLVDELNDALLENLAAHAHRIDFAEYATPFVVELRAVLKRLRVAAYERAFRQTFEKVKQTCLLIRDRRAAVDEHTSSLDLTDSAAINRWNAHSKSLGTPLQEHFVQHRKTREVQIRMMLANAADRDRDKEPLEKALVEPRAKQLATEDDRSEFSALFDRFYFDEPERPIEEQIAAKSNKKQPSDDSVKKGKKRRKAEKRLKNATKNGNVSNDMFSLADLPNLADTVE